VTRDEVAWPDRATALSVPGWLLERWTAAFGAQTAEGIARAALETPERYVRVAPGETPPAGAEPTAIPGCYRVSVPSARQMDIGSQSIVPFLELAPGVTFLDISAAPGNKTAQALETPLHAIACDASPARLGRMKSLGIPLVAADAREPLPFSKRFDRILLDAPCSGTGTLAHNPEIKWRLTPQDISRQAERQRAMLANAIALLAPGGTLVYSTCSLELEENEQVIGAVASGQVRNVSRRMPGREAGDGFFAAVLGPVIT
jgi:16S rRNA (cytosine967-C5)-methyltransferase